MLSWNWPMLWPAVLWYMLWFLLTGKEQKSSSELEVLSCIQLCGLEAPAFLHRGPARLGRAFTTFLAEGIVCMLWVELAGPARQLTHARPGSVQAQRVRIALRTCSVGLNVCLGE